MKAKNQPSKLPTHIFDKVHSGVIATDSEGTIVYFNSAAKGTFSGIRSGLALEDIFTFVIEEGGKPQAFSTSAIGKQFKKNQGFDTTPIKIGDDHGIKSLMLNVGPLDDYMVFNLSETEKTSGLNSMLIEEAPIAIHIYDKDATLLVANKAWEDLWDAKRESAIGWYNLLRDRSIISLGLDQHFKKAQRGHSGEFGDVHFRSDTNRGAKKKFVSTKYFPLLDEGGNVERIVIFNEDVTTRVEVQNQLADSEEQLTAMLQNLPGLTYMIAHDPYRVIYMNKVVLEVCGYPEQDFLSGAVEWRKLASKEDLDRMDPIWQKSVKNQENYTIEYEVQHKDGHWITVRDSGTGVFDKRSNLKYVVGYIEDITETKAIQEAIRLNEIKFRSVFENAGHGIAIADSKGLFLEANKRAHQILGYKKGELENIVTTLDITFPEEHDSTKERLQALGSGKLKRATVEKRYIRKDGTPIWVTVSTSTFKNPVSGENMLVGIIDDITESRKVIQDISASELKFRSVFEETGHGIAILNEELLIIDSNDKFRSILVITKKLAKAGVSMVDFEHQDFRGILKDFRAQLKKDTSKKIQSEARLVNKKGGALWVRMDLSAYEDPHSSELRMVLIVEDITRRKLAQEELQRSEDFQKETIDSLSVGLMVMSTSGDITLTNKVWDQIAKNTKSLKEASVGKNFLEVIKEMEDRSTLMEGLTAVIDEESSLFEFEISLDQRGQSWFVLRGSKLQSQFDSVVITLQEITVRKRVEQALEESLRNYRNIYNHTPVMMHSIDTKGKLVSVSNFWLEKLGYRRHEVIGKNLRDFLTEESKNDADIILPVFFEKGSIFDVSYHFVTKNGDILETLLSAIEEGKGTASARSLAVVTDITLLKQTERELKKNRQDLLEAQSMAKIGNFELNPATRTFTSSEVFDEILEIERESQKTFDLLPQIAPAEDIPKIIEMMAGVFGEGKPLDYTGRGITLQTKRPIWVEILGRVEMENGRAIRVVGTVQDITKSKNYEVEIQHLSERLSLAMEGANIGVWEFNLREDHLHYEPTMYELFELEPPNKFGWEELIEATHEEDEDKVVAIKDKIMEGEDLVEEDFRLKLKSGIRHFRSVTQHITDQNGIDRILGVVMDITGDKNLLHRLEVSLHEKDILIKEVHHRVKNNMQMISSILALKSLDLQDADSKRVFDDCTTRVKSMAVVHDQLYRFYNVSEISISEYLNHLLGSLNALLVGGAGNFQMKIEADDHLMDVDVALLCGLIVSEIVANAFKHGFKNMDSGEVNVLFKVNGDDKHLIVTNSGAPIPENILEMKTSSLGMSLIRTFTNQLQGKIQYHPDNGLEVIF